MINEEDELFGPAAPEPDRPGLYYVTMYVFDAEGNLQDHTTTASYRARNEEMAKVRALKQYPDARIVDVDFHVEDEDDDEQPVDEL